MADKEEKAKAKQLQDYANVANKPPLLGDSLADSLTALQAGIATSKETVKAKNIEIPTIKFEMAAKDGDVLAMTAAAKEIAKASEYGPFQTKTFVDSIVKKNTPVPVTISTMQLHLILILILILLAIKLLMVHRLLHQLLCQQV
jgi:hypothetical protein